MVHRVSITLGVAFDVAQRLSNSERNRLRNLAQESGVWSYVEPASLTPTWVGKKLVSEKYELLSI